MDCHSQLTSCKTFFIEIKDNHILYTWGCPFVNLNMNLIPKPFWSKKNKKVGNDTSHLTSNNPSHEVPQIKKGRPHFDSNNNSNFSLNWLNILLWQHSICDPAHDLPQNQIVNFSSQLNNIWLKIKLSRVLLRTSLQKLLFKSEVHCCSVTGGGNRWVG